MLMRAEKAPLGGFYWAMRASDWFLWEICFRCAVCNDTKHV
jgi:hypothetical protein